MDSNVNQKMNVLIFEELRCPKCQASYNGQVNCPKVFPCGHTLCGKCCAENSFCLECEKEYPNSTIILTNFLLKSLVRNNKDNKIKGHHSGSCSRIKIIAATKFRSKGFCEEHGNPLLLRCHESEMFICYMCAALEHKLCTIVHIKDAAEVIGRHDGRESYNKYFKDISEMLLFLKYNIKRNELELKFLNFCKDEPRDKTVTAIELKRKMKMMRSIEALIEKLVIFLESLKSTYEPQKDAKKLVFDVAHCEGLPQGSNMLEIFDKRRERIRFDLSIPKHLTFEGLRYLVQQYPYEAHAWTIQNDVKIYGKLVIKGEAIYIHSFETESPKGMPLLVSFRNLLICCQGSTKLPQKVFFKLANTENPSETVELVIESDIRSSMAKNFHFLCSGLKGKSYKGHTLDCFQSMFCALYSKTPTVIKTGVKITKTALEAGLVYGYRKSNLSDFYIEFGSKLDKFKEKDLIDRFGIVISGLKKLNELNSTFTKLSVENCGLLISA